MNAKELRSKSAAELTDELLKLRKEQFSLRMQRATGQTVKPTDFSRVRKSVARLKTIVREQQIGSAGAAKGAPAATAKVAAKGAGAKAAAKGAGAKAAAKGAGAKAAAKGAGAKAAAKGAGAKAAAKGKGK